MISRALARELAEANADYAVAFASQSTDVHLATCARRLADLQRSCRIQLVDPKLLRAWYDPRADIVDAPMDHE